jgi:hypothetical protein
MANTTSAKKATRKIARRTVVNKARRTKLRTAVRSVEEAIKSGDRNAAVWRGRERMLAARACTAAIFPAVRYRETFPRVARSRKQKARRSRA